jgi:hypothetical protein
MKSLFQKTAIFLASAFLTGCLYNPYAINYRDVKATIPPAYRNVIRPASGAAQLIQVDDINGQTVVYVKRGYVVLGYSGFSGGADIKAIRLYDLSLLAKDVGA